MLSKKISGKGGGKGEHLWLWHLSSQVATKHAEALLPRKWLDICLLMGSAAFCFAYVLLCTAFVSLIKW